MLSIKQSKFIKSLKIKKYRTQERCFIVEGRKNVLEAIKMNLNIRYLLATEQFIESNHGALQNVSNDTLFTTNEKTLVSLGTFKSNQDCLAVLQMPSGEDVFLDVSKTIVALDGVSDPGNLGTIIRTLDWFGINQLVCSPDTADVFNPKVVNATMGSFTRVNVQYTDLVDFVKQSPLEAYGADLDGIEISNWKPTGPIILLMGSESHGISEEVKKSLEGTVTIPRQGKAESLNVAIATGILCHHVAIIS